jgi:hypothetical protein
VFNAQLDGAGKRAEAETSERRVEWRNCHNLTSRSGILIFTGAAIETKERIGTAVK